MHMLQLSGWIASVAMLVLVSMFCSQFPQTVGSNIPAHQKYYLSCIVGCVKDNKQCYRDCDDNNTCEASREFCKKLCLRKAISCDKTCLDKTVRLYKKLPPNW